MSRRADTNRLADLLEADPADVDTARAADRTLALLATAIADALPPTPPIRPEFRAQLRSQLLDAARDLQPEPAARTRMRDGVQRMRYSTSTATVAGVTALALSGGGVAAAAEPATPGDALYGTKINLEDVRLTTTFGASDRATRSMSYAFDRVGEATSEARRDEQQGVVIALNGCVTRVQQATAWMLDAGGIDLAMAFADDVASMRLLLDDLEGMVDETGFLAVGDVRLALGETEQAIAEVMDQEGENAPSTAGPGVPSASDVPGQVDGDATAFPVDPTRPGAAEPNPTQVPEQPTEPVTAGGTETPTQAGTPGAPGTPAVPAVPGGPGTPAVPAVPGGPGTPAVPAVPGGPGTPAVPAVPGGPGTPAVPAVPGSPEIPVPDLPVDPESPTLQVPIDPDVPNVPQWPLDPNAGRGPLPTDTVTPARLPTPTAGQVIPSSPISGATPGDPVEAPEIPEDPIDVPELPEDPIDVPELPEDPIDVPVIPEDPVDDIVPML